MLPLNRVKKVFFILLTLGIAFYFIPATAKDMDMPCHEHEEMDMSCCKEENTTASNDAVDDDISSNLNQPEKQKDEHGCCEGGCPASACHCPVTAVFVTVLTQTKSADWLDPGIGLFPSIPSDVSIGFSSIWRPPKIG